VVPQRWSEGLRSLARVERSGKERWGRIVALAFAYNTLGIAAAVTGHLHPVLAATLMLASSLSVTTLAARAGASGTIHYLP
jgi:cation transport ATPase